MAKLTLEDVQRECDFALQDLEPLFQPHCRLTLLMRNPEAEDGRGDMVVTRDDLLEVAAAILRLRKHDGSSVPKFWTGPGGELMCDTEIDGARPLGGAFFICETVTNSAAIKIAEALGGEFVEKVKTHE